MFPVSDIILNILKVVNIQKCIVAVEVISHNLLNNKDIENYLPETYKDTKGDNVITSLAKLVEGR